MRSLETDLKNLNEPLGTQRVIKLGYLVSHPIQYQAPLLRELAKEPWVDLKVLFMSDFSLKKYQDPGFGQTVSWDVPLVDGYDHEFLAHSGPSKPIEGMGLWHPELKKRLVENRFDALWIHGYAQWTCLRSILYSRQLGTKVLMRAESQMGSYHGTGLFRKVKEAVIRQVFKQIDAFLPIGSLNADYYMHYGVPKQKLFQVPYAVDNSFFQKKALEAAPNREKLRAELGLESGRPIILFCSKLQTRKRAADLVRAYVKLAVGSNEPVPYLLIIGDGEERQNLEALIATYKWSSIKMLGFKNQTELPAYFDLCDVFVLPSDREPWGLIVNEVMNASRAVIVTEDVGSGPDLVKNGVNGFIYPVGDIDQLADCLRKVVQDPSTAEKMGTLSLQRINQWSFKEDIEGIKQAVTSVCSLK